MGQIQNSLNQMFTSLLHSGYVIQQSPYVKGQKAINVAKSQHEVAKTNLTGDAQDRINRVSGNLDKIDVENITSLEDAQKVQQELADMGDTIRQVKRTTQNAIKAEMDAEDKVMEAQLRYGTKKQREEAIPHLAQRQLEKDQAKSNPKSSAKLDQAGYSMYGSLQEAYNQKQGVLKATIDRLKAVKGGSV